jgi:hypothetical protein
MKKAYCTRTDGNYDCDACYLADYKHHRDCTGQDIPIDLKTCDRCGRVVDDDAYSQVQNYRGYKVIAYYCDNCRQLLTSIGAGEYTAMQDRADDRGDNTPDCKEDF